MSEVWTYIFYREDMNPNEHPDDWEYVDPIAGTPARARLNALMATMQEMNITHTMDIDYTAGDEVMENIVRPYTLTYMLIDVCLEAGDIPDWCVDYVLKYKKTLQAYADEITDGFEWEEEYKRAEDQGEDIEMLCELRSARDTKRWKKLDRTTKQTDAAEAKAKQAIETRADIGTKQRIKGVGSNNNIKG
jgi:hypothetical protein